MNMSEKVCNEVCFALIESPVDGFVMRFSPTTVLIVNVTKEWVDAGEYDALKAAKPDAYNREDNWVSMPRSVLKNHDVSFGDLGYAKI